MPKVVTDQRAAYESNELFRRLSRETEIKYTGYRDRAADERQLRFQNSCRAGRAEIAFVTSGMNLTLQFYPWNMDNIQGISPPKDYVNFDREPGKVYLKSPFILNGVCVCWKGWINLHRLEGMGSIEYDDEWAQVESAQQQNNPTQSLHKTQNQKSQVNNHKHSNSGNGSGQHDKRPRLH